MTVNFYLLTGPVALNLSESFPGLMSQQKKGLLRNVLRVLFFLLIVVQQALAAQNDSISCVEIEGKVLADENASKLHYWARLYLNNRIIDSVSNKLNKNFEFNLLAGKYYTVLISLPGYVERSICFDTRNALYVRFDKPMTFFFKTQLHALSSKEGKNQDSYDYPIGIVYYDRQLHAFSYDKKYTNQMKRELRETSVEH